MDNEKFEMFLQKRESTILDFKSEQYDIIGDQTGEKTAEFIKDIISFANTIRKENAFIIVGIKELNFGKLDLIGLDKYIDDSIFQQKIKDKVNPRPIFSYSTFNFNDINFGIFEIPVTYYPMPITSLKNLKRLEKDKVYFRRGTSNSEATIQEVIQINDWLRSLKKSVSESELSDKLYEILVSLNDSDKKLGPIAAELMNMAKKTDSEEIGTFFSNEISGWYFDNAYKLPKDFFNYRMVSVIFSKIVINSITSNIENTAQRVYNDLKKRGDSREMELFFYQSIASIESQLEKIKLRGKTELYSEKHAIKDLLPDSSLSGEIMIYYLSDVYYVLKENIRHKYIEELNKLIIKPSLQ